MSLNKFGLTWVILLWFLISTVIIFWFASAAKSEFDPQLKLSQAIMSSDFEQSLVKSLLPSLSKLEPQVHLFHIVQNNCYCEWLAQSHVRNLTAWSKTQDFSNVTLDISDYPNLREFVPSTPAIIAIDKRGKLLYMGPYSRGSGCFAGSGQVDQYLQQWLDLPKAMKNKQNAIVDTEASGCYCNT